MSRQRPPKSAEQREFDSFRLREPDVASRISKEADLRDLHGAERLAFQLVMARAALKVTRAARADMTRRKWRMIFDAMQAALAAVSVSQKAPDAPIET